MLILPSIVTNDVIKITENLRLAISQYTLAYNSLKSVTVSIGIVSVNNDDGFFHVAKEVEELILQEKMARKNKVIVK
jgi:GGDEF domain-containing protein